MIAFALQDTQTCPTIPPFKYAGDGVAWPYRDGRITISAVGRDWFRGFRITVETVDIKDLEGDLQDDWRKVAD